MDRASRLFPRIKVGSRVPRDCGGYDVAIIQQEVQSMRTGMVRRVVVAAVAGLALSAAAEPILLQAKTIRPEEESARPRRLSGSPPPGQCGRHRRRLRHQLRRHHHRGRRHRGLWRRRRSGNRRRLQQQLRRHHDRPWHHARRRRRQRLSGIHHRRWLRRHVRHDHP